MGLGRIVQMLKTSKEFDFVYKNSYKFRTEMLDICVLRANLASEFFAKFRRLPCNLVGFSVSKKVGNAVNRNLVKRRLRAICREFFSQRNSSLRADSQNLVKNNPSLRNFAKQSCGNPPIKKMQNLQSGLPRRFCESARNDGFLDSSVVSLPQNDNNVDCHNFANAKSRNDGVRRNLICIFIAKSQILQTPFATLKSIIFDALKKQLNFRQDLHKKPRMSRQSITNHSAHYRAFQNPNYNPNKGAL